MQYHNIMVFFVFMAGGKDGSVVNCSRNRNFLHHRHKGGDSSGFFEAETSNWRWHEEDYLVTNWQRKCSAFEIKNAVKSFISGGLQADMEKFPYLVGLLMFDPPRVYQCGGSLISKKYVLTAGHCLIRSSFGRVYIGSYIYANAASAEFVFNVTRSDFIINERYNGRRGFLDDIALIYLRDAVTLSARVQIIPLALNFMTEQFLRNELVTAAGWGRTADNSTEVNTQLYYVVTPVMSFEKCMCFYLPGLVNRRKHICADGTGGRGGCDGDSGGPLIFSYRNNDYLVGVTSFGSAGGCEIGHPTVYTKVANYLNWIYKKTSVK